MNEITFPVQSNSTIIKASISALVIASIVFVSIILPAEYNIDPIGTGKILGLTVLAGDLPDDAEKPVAVGKASDVAQSSSLQENQATIIVPPHKGVEYKFKIAQYGNITYQWDTKGEPLYFDFHGEPKGDTTGYFESYTIATASEVKGSMTVPFDGVHGWYWKNNSDRPVTINLKTKGDYQIVGLLH